MMKLFATLLSRKPMGAPGRKALSPDDDPEAESAPVFEGLAMTEELREALFPKTPQMVSAIFDRPAPLTRAPLSAAMPSPASGGRGFPIIF